jgi:hypothetical protein
MDEESGIAIFRYKKPISPTDITQTTSSGISVDQSLSVEVGVQTFVVWVSPKGARKQSYFSNSV